MKSLSNKLSGAVTALLVLGFSSTATTAGVSTMDSMAGMPAQVQPGGELQRAAGNAELPTSQDRSQRNQSDSIMQCWQYGRLIMDERDWDARGNEMPGPVLYSGSGQHAKLRLMQFGDTFCALKYGDRAR